MRQMAVKCDQDGGLMRSSGMNNVSLKNYAFICLQL